MDPAQLNLKKSSHFQIAFWVIGIILFFYFIALIKSILLPFVIGMLTAYFLDPSVRYLRRYNISRSTAAGLITIIFFLIAAGLVFELVPAITGQLGVLVKELPDYIHNLQNKYGYDVNMYMEKLGDDEANAIRDTLSNYSANLAGWAEKLFSDVLRSGLALLNILSLVFLTPIVVFYMLRDWDRLVEKVNGLLPRKHAQTIQLQLHNIDRTLSGFIRGQTNVCLIMAGYYSIMLTLCGLNFALGLGIMTGLLLFIPFIGIATCFTLSMLVGLFQFGADIHLLSILGVYLLGMTLESSVLTPKLVGHQVGLHPLWIIFGMLTGAALFGLVGVLISVPVTAVIGVLVRFALDRYRNSTLYLSS